MPCVSCGYKKDKYILCDRCHKTVCHKCLTTGLCKDCFTLVECKKYYDDYEYKQQMKNET